MALGNDGIGDVKGAPGSTPGSAGVQVSENRLRVTNDAATQKNRIAGNTGLGYQILKRDKFTIEGQLGSGFSRSWGSENQWRPEGVVGLVFSWKPLPGHEFTADVTYYPDFSDLPEFRLLANANYIVGITQLDGLSLKFGAKNEYDSNQPGDNNNLKYYANVVYDF